MGPFLWRDLLHVRLIRFIFFIASTFSTHQAVQVSRLHIHTYSRHIFLLHSQRHLIL